MSLRTQGYTYYGLTNREVKKILRYCRDTNFTDDKNLLACAKMANPDIARDLYQSIRFGISYDKAVPNIPISKGDFYAYRRKCIWFYWKMVR